MSLELLALRWLRFERNCPIAIRERCPRWICGEPDALGITKSRYMIEIEIKRSVSDFRADALKPSRRERQLWIKQLPRQFYYLVPRDLELKVAPLVPAWAGLLIPGTRGGLLEAKLAPRNLEATKLTVKECLKLVLMVNNHAIGELTAVLGLKNFDPFPEPDYQI